jgi:hypothetical protein
MTTVSHGWSTPNPAGALEIIRDHDSDFIALWAAACVNSKFRHFVYRRVLLS